MYKVYKYQNISTTAVVNCCTVCGCFLPPTYRVQYRHTLYFKTYLVVIIAVLTVDLFSPSQLLSVHVCIGLEFRVGYDAFYGNDHGKRKHTHHHKELRMPVSPYIFYNNNNNNTTRVNREKMYLVFLSMSAACVLCVFSSHSFWTSNSLDVPAGVTQEEGHTGFLIHLLSAVRAFIFLARRNQPFLSLIDREVMANNI